MSNKNILRPIISQTFTIQSPSSIRIRGVKPTDSPGSESSAFVNLELILMGVPYDYREIDLSFGDQGTFFTIVYPRGEKIFIDEGPVECGTRIKEGKVTFSWRTGCGLEGRDVSVYLKLSLHPSENKLTIEYSVL